MVQLLSIHVADQQTGTSLPKRVDECILARLHTPFAPASVLFSVNLANHNSHSLALLKTVTNLCGAVVEKAHLFEAQ